MASQDSQQTSRNVRTASLLLSFVAGYVDSSTFLALFGFFIAQLTGSFVTVGAQIAQREHGLLLTTFAIPTFLIAGAATTLLVEFAGKHRGSPFAWSAALEGGLLTAFLIVGTIAEPFAYPNAPLAVAAGLFGLSAMGVQSAAVQLVMRGMPSTNVMTTNTTHIAVLATQTLLAWHARRRARDDRSAAQLASTGERLQAVLRVAAGFLTGTIAGALLYSMMALWALLVPIAIILGLLIWTLRTGAFAPDH
jgi:uncharacterized membrane protein YoaK (UPF0700 family)